MQWVGFAELAAGVSNAGGLGIVCCCIPRIIPQHRTKQTADFLSSLPLRNQPLKTSGKKFADAVP